jgi:hypothetical protein
MEKKELQKKRKEKDNKANLVSTPKFKSMGKKRKLNNFKRPKRANISEPKIIKYGGP